MADNITGGSNARAAFPVGLRFMVLSAFFFSVMSLLVKLAGQRLPSQEIVLARSLIMAGISFAGLRGRRISVSVHGRACSCSAACSGSARSAASTTRSFTCLSPMRP